MKLSQLEILYDFEPKKFEYIDRKFSITDKKIVIQAPSHSGITYLLLNYMQNFDKKERLYIDFSDIRIEINLLIQKLQKFIDNNSIKLLILDNFKFNIDLPKCEQIIISTKQKPPQIDEFSYKKFYPLDFEEYIAFEKRYSNIEQIFNNFANRGTFPEICLSNDIDIAKKRNYIINSLTKDEKELQIFKELASCQSKTISFYPLYKNLKRRIKISKDSFYSIIEKFEKEQIVIFVEKHNNPAGQKKLFLIDFYLKNALTFEKDFIKRFENIVFLELHKKEKSIYYTPECDFYLPDEKIAILCIPFMPTNLLKNKISKRKKAFKKLGLKRVQIISLGNEDSFVDSGIEYEILPFWNWALTLE